MRQMHFVAFLQAQNCTTIPASWRHPDARTDSYSPDYYQHIARVLEAGKFDIGFFDDRLAMPDMFMGDHAHTVQNGIRCVKMDPTTCLMTMAAVTKYLGLGATYSTTYYEPFHVARVFQTIDLMSRGRAAWNVVTSVNDNEARNMGREGVIEHDTRYDRADEFMEVVLGHWDSWDDDAIVVDKVNNLYAHPDKVRRLDYKGKFLSSRGPFTVPRSPQGHPVVIQAGQSGRGRRFAARWGELIFVHYPNLEVGRKNYAELKAGAAAMGRNPDHMKITTLAYVVTGESKAQAEDRKAAYDKLPNEIDQLSLLSEALNFDFATKGLDEPFTEEEIAGIQGMHTMRDRVMASGIEEPDRARFHADYRTRPAQQSLGRRAEGDRRHAGGMVHRAGLRRLRHRPDPPARLLRGFREIRGAGAAEARHLPQGLHGPDAARPSGPAEARHRVLEDNGRRGGLSAR